MDQIELAGLQDLRCRACPPVRQVSSVLRALDVLADPWAFLVLRECFFGVRRFDDFQLRLQIARNVLSERLDHLVHEGVLSRVPYQTRPPRDDYRLTAAGRQFYPAIVALMGWGDRWRPAEHGPPLLLSRRHTGRPLRPHVVCGACGAAVSPFDVAMHPGLGAGAEDAIPSDERRRSSALDVYTRGRPCSVAAALTVIGDRWSFRVLRDAFFGIRRFDAFLASTGASRNVLAGRLQALVTAGVLERRPYHDRPLRHEYTLSRAGLDLYPVFLLLMAWGDTWRRPEAGVPLILTHLPCGSTLRPVMTDAEDGAAIAAESVAYDFLYPDPPECPSHD